MSIRSQAGTLRLISLIIELQVYFDILSFQIVGIRLIEITQLSRIVCKYINIKFYRTRTGHNHFTPFGMSTREIIHSLKRRNQDQIRDIQIDFEDNGFKMTPHYQRLRSNQLQVYSNFLQSFFNRFSDNNGKEDKLTGIEAFNDYYKKYK